MCDSRTEKDDLKQRSRYNEGAEEAKPDQRLTEIH